MSQFLGDSSSYINLERVSMIPESDLAPVSPPQSSISAAEGSATAGARAIASGAGGIAAGAAQAAAQSVEAGAAAQANLPGASQAETQTLVGATQALKAEARAKAEASAEIASSNPQVSQAATKCL